MSFISKKKAVSLLCKTSLQPLMHRLYLTAATGMNYGNANTLDHHYTGEKKAIEYIKGKIVSQQFITVFDVGANAGNYSLLIAELFKEKQLKIYAFEPSKHNYSLLIENTTGLNCIQCLNFGLGRTEETVSLYSNYEGSGATSLYSNAFAQYNQNRHVLEQSELKTLDEFCRKNGINKIDFLKIDVEGHELFVLQGGSDLINNKKIAFIQFEFGPFHVYSKTFFKNFWDLLSPLYHIYRIITDGLYEIKSYSENLEIFRTSNFLAELKAFPS